MNQYELDKEYNEFITKFAKTGKEFVNDFNNLSAENKRKFQTFLKTFSGKTITDFSNFLNAKF